MSSDFQVILDACVLVNAALRDTLLRLAEPPCSLYLPRWSRDIIEEKNVKKVKSEVTAVLMMGQLCAFPLNALHVRVKVGPHDAERSWTIFAPEVPKWSWAEIGLIDSIYD